MPSMRRCAIWCVLVSTRCMRYAGHASNSRASCCARAAITDGRLGPSCIAAGSPGSSSSRRCIISCLRDYIAAIEAAEARRDRLTAQIEAMLPDWTLASVVAALQTMRGMALVNAATLIAELGDLSRFANARQLMAYLGLVPSEHSSGASVKRGGLTKAARRLLIEAAWCYRFPARVSRELRLRQRSSPGRSARSPGTRSCGCAPAIADSPAVASRPMSSPARSPASWPASYGPLPGVCRRRRADRNKGVIASKGGASEPRKHATAGQGRGHGRGQENPRIHYLPDRRSDAGR